MLRALPTDHDSVTKIYHLAESEHWLRAQPDGIYDRSTRNKSLADVGFIHCSFREQVHGVAEFVYGDFAGQLLLLEMDLDRLEAAGLTVLVEDGGNGQDFPHIYGALPVELVDQVVPFTRE